MTGHGSPIGAKVQREGTPTEKLIARAELQEEIRREVLEFRATHNREELMLKKIAEIKLLPYSEGAERMATFRVVITQAGLMPELTQIYQNIQTAKLRRPTSRR